MNRLLRACAIGLRSFTAVRASFSMLLRLAIYVCVVDTVRAGVVYSQIGPSPPISAYSSNDSGSATDQKIADNFLIGGSDSVTVRSLRFIGGYGVRNPPPSTPSLDSLPLDNFRIVFFSDSVGGPGTPLTAGDFDAVAPVVRIPTGGPLLGSLYTPLEYVVDLGPGITLNSSTVYWLSIVNNPGNNYFWDWANTVGAFDQGVAGTFSDISSGSWTVSSSGGMYFQLHDSNVPEPGAFEILLALGFGMRSIARTRHKTN